MNAAVELIRYCARRLAVKDRAIKAITGRRGYVLPEDERSYDDENTHCYMANRIRKEIRFMIPTFAMDAYPYAFLAHTIHELYGSNSAVFAAFAVGDIPHLKGRMRLVRPPTWFERLLSIASSGRQVLIDDTPIPIDDAEKYLNEFMRGDELRKRWEVYYFNINTSMGVPKYMLVYGTNVNIGRLAQIGVRH